jgi:hypothetical protein
VTDLIWCISFLVRNYQYGHHNIVSYTYTIKDHDIFNYCKLLKEPLAIIQSQLCFPCEETKAQRHDKAK